MKSLRPGTVVCQTFTCIFWVQAWARDACWVFSCIALHSIVWAWKFTILSRLVGRQLQGPIHLPQRWSSGHTSALPTGDEDLNSGLLVFTASALDSESSLQPQNCFFFLVNMWPFPHLVCFASPNQGLSRQVSAMTKIISFKSYLETRTKVHCRIFLMHTVHSGHCMFSSPFP